MSLYLLNFNKLFFLTVLFVFLSFAKASSSNLDNKIEINQKILSPQDVKNYSKIFKLQKQSIKNKKSQIWKQIDLELGKTKDQMLKGTVLASRYLHPTGWRSSYTELKNWLKKYHDHPDAYRIYRLAKKRKPKKSQPLKKPSGNFLNGYGNYSSSLIHPKFPIDYKGHKYPRSSYRISQKVRKGINKKQLNYVEKLLSSNSTKKYLTTKELAQLRAEFSHAQFIFGNYTESLRQSRISISLSNEKNALAFWSGGLSAWRLKDFIASKWFFNKLCELKIGPESLLSGGCFWSAKVEYVLGKTNQINKFLKKATTYERTFYSTLAISTLGYKENFDFHLPIISRNFIMKLKSFEGGKRVLGLLQISENHLAEREFRKIIFNFDVKEYPEIISFATKNNMPGFAFRLSAILRNDHKKILLGGLYPVPAWDVKRLEIKDRALIYSISRQESGFNPRAKSSASALGLMQILPSTAAFIMKDKYYKYKSKKHLLYQGDRNIKIGTKYMSFLLSLDDVRNDLIKMLASYNAGPGNLKKWTKKRGLNKMEPLMVIESLPARQTRNYIKLVLTNLSIYQIRLNESAYILSNLTSGKDIKYLKGSKND